MSSINAPKAGAYIGEIAIILTATKFDNKVYVQTKGDFYKSKKSCSKNKYYAFAFDGTTPIGKNSFHHLHLKTNYLDNCVSITKLSAEIVDHYKQTLNSNIP